jgi:hypothetical protein
MSDYRRENQQIEGYIKQLREKFVSRGQRFSTSIEEDIAEVRAHLMAMYDAYLELNYSPEEAATLTLTKFGKAEVVFESRGLSPQARNSVAVFVHLTVGAIVGAVASVNLVTSILDSGLSAMPYGAIIGVFVAWWVQQTRRSPLHFGALVAIAGSGAYVPFGLWQISQHALPQAEFGQTWGFVTLFCFLVAFIQRWSWLVSRSQDSSLSTRIADPTGGSYGNSQPLPR